MSELSSTAKNEAEREFLETKERHTDNVYYYPLDSKDIIRTDFSSPAHVGRLENSIDFLCDVDTKIGAAFDGVVISVVDGKTEGGPKQDINDAGNYVLVSHENGEYSHYAHLRCGGVAVKKGESVKAGDLIGFSGNTGFSFGPHLHFSVIRFTESNNPSSFESLKIRWSNK